MLEEIFKKYLLKPISIIIFALIAGLFCIQCIPSEDETYFRFIITICFWFLALVTYCAFVFGANKLPSASKKQLGVLFVFHTQTDDIYKDAKFNIVQHFEEVSNQFEIHLIPICINVNKIKNYCNGNKNFMTKLLIHTNCIFCVDIIYQIDDIKQTNDYELKINTGTLHPKLSDESNQILIGELRRVSKPLKNLKFNKDKKIETLKITATHLNLAAKYIIALIFILSKKYEFSDKLLQDIYIVTRNENNWFFELIKKAYFNSCVGMELTNFDKFYLFRDMSYINSAEKYLKIMDSLFPNTYGFNLDMAWIEFVKYRNVTKAKLHIATCKKIGVTDTWMYSEAFLEAYSGGSITSVIKKYEQAINTDYNIVDIISFVENILEEEPDKCILHFALALLYHSFGDKKLSSIHLNTFIENYTINPQDKYLIKIISQIKDNACCLCKVNNCEQCKKIA